MVGWLPDSSSSTRWLTIIRYSITDKVAYLPSNLLTGQVTYNACFHNLPTGLQTHVYAPAGLIIKGKWTVGGSEHGEKIEPRELGLDLPLQGLYLREDTDMKCNVLFVGMVKKNLKKSHARLVEKLIELAEQQGKLAGPEYREGPRLDGPEAVQAQRAQQSRHSQQSMSQQSISQQSIGQQSRHSQQPIGLHPYQQNQQWPLGALQTSVQSANNDIYSPSVYSPAPMADTNTSSIAPFSSSQPLHPPPRRSLQTSRFELGDTSVPGCSAKQNARPDPSLFPAPLVIKPRSPSITPSTSPTTPTSSVWVRNFSRPSSGSSEPRGRQRASQEGLWRRSGQGMVKSREASATRTHQRASSSGPWLASGQDPSRTGCGKLRKARKSWIPSRPPSYTVDSTPLEPVIVPQRISASRERPSILAHASHPGTTARRVSSEWIRIAAHENELNKLRLYRSSSAIRGAGPKYTGDEIHPALRGRSQEMSRASLDVDTRPPYLTVARSHVRSRSAVDAGATARMLALERKEVNAGGLGWWGATNARGRTVMV